jgi:hypothetical protein
VKRVGECSQCSLCCRILLLPIPHPSAVQRTPLGIRAPLPIVVNPDLLHFYRTRGLGVGAESVEVPLPPSAPVRLGRQGKTLVARVPHVCAQLDPRGRCKIHGTPDYPRACAVFPRTPDDLLDVADECTYRFVDD